jgi:hypothetical protein
MKDSCNSCNNNMNPLDSFSNCNSQCWRHPSSLKGQKNLNSSNKCKYIKDNEEVLSTLKKYFNNIYN